MKALPLKLWLELEDSVARHKAEVAQNFAEARAQLLPEPPKTTSPHDWLSVIDWRAAQARWHAEAISNAAGAGGIHDPRTGAVIWPAGREVYEMRLGLLGLGFLGL